MSYSIINCSGSKFDAVFENDTCIFEVDFGEVFISGDNEFDAYDGEYEFIPSIEQQTIHTAEKYVKEDIVIKAVPYSEVTNISNGKTVTIC